MAPGDSVTLTSLNPATTYNWDIVFVPQGSSATVIGSGVSVGFLVDLQGPYLVRLITDVGLMSEDTQYVRLRALTSPLGLRLVSAGERRDSSGVIPVDVDIEGWANDQNYNLLTLESALGSIVVPLVYHLGLPVSPNNTVDYRGWAPQSCKIKSVRAYMGAVNNQGNYTLDVVNGSTGNSCLLGGATFDMNGLVADTVTDVPLKAVGDADLDFPAAGRWTVYLASDDVAFDGQNVYVELVFEVT